MADTSTCLIRNATIVDGTGAPRYAGDIGVRGDRIVQIGRLGAARADVEIDAAGKVAAPGFIDAHTHDDRLMLSAPDMAPKVSQGVTTVVAGNCGISLAPAPGGMSAPITPPLDLLDDEGGWFRFPTFARLRRGAAARSRAATNCALLVGHTTLRVATLDDLERPATPGDRRACARWCARRWRRRDRRLHRPVLRAGGRCADRGSHRSLPAADGVRRHSTAPTCATRPSA